MVMSYVWINGVLVWCFAPVCSNWRCSCLMFYSCMLVLTVFLSDVLLLCAQIDGVLIWCFAPVCSNWRCSCLILCSYVLVLTVFLSDVLLLSARIDSVLVWCFTLVCSKLTVFLSNVLLLSARIDDVLIWCFAHMCSNWRCSCLMFCSYVLVLTVFLSDVLLLRARIDGVLIWCFALVCSNWRYSCLIFYSYVLGTEDEKTINVNPTNDTSSMNLDQPRRSLQTKPNYQRWLRIVVYTFLLLSGQSVGTMLGRLYFDKGGKSKWLATLVSLIGFPILLPLYMIKSPKISSSNITLQSNPPTTTKLIFVYVSLGLLVAINCFLYSVGLMYLHVSTFSLICASQLAFNALFSYFINSLVFTPFIVNSLVLLTISSSLLIFQSDPVSDTSSDGPEHPTSRAKFITGKVWKRLELYDVPTS